MSIHPGVLGKYELQRQLGRGGMAEVWQAVDRRLQRSVAIKFLNPHLQDDPTFTARFLREARAVASLRHPNIVQVYDFETTAPEGAEAQAYMVMDYIDGPTLAEYLHDISQARRFPSPTEMVSLFFAISGAVDYAHQHGVLHRDIKPSNILLDRHHTTRNPMGEPILTDFGIAKLLGSANGTLTSELFGTPLYIAPEQARGKATGPASDLYSLGVILYEMCTGTLPFKGETPIAILQQQISMPPPPPESINPAISSALSAVILRSLTKDPAERFPSALALTIALAGALHVPLPEKTSLSGSFSDLPTVSMASRPQSAFDTQMAGGSIEAAPHPGSGTPTVFAVPPRQLETPVAQNPAVLEKSPLHAAFPAGEDGPLAPLRHLSVPVRRKRGLFLLLLGCLCAALLGSGMVAFSHLHAGIPTSQIVGSGFFTSSGSGNGANNVGINDTFQVRLTNVPAPVQGEQYYAWLLPDQNMSEANPRALGTLVVNDEVATLAQPYMDPQHQNLVAQFSRFLVTEEAMNPAPQSPSLNTNLWRYYAAIPQTPPAMNCQGVINQLSVLCHLRHLLSGDPELAQVNLHGGLNYWFLNNVEEMQKWARETVDHGNPVDVRHKLVNILYILDGRTCITQDIQQHGAAGMDNVPDDRSLASIAAIPLLSCALTPDVPNYLAHIHNHLNAMIQSPGVLSDQVTLANQIGTELNTINAWLIEVQRDARQLLGMSNDQLVQAQGQSLRNQLDTLATNVLSGGTDASTGQLEKGVASIADQIQQLAVMDITAYSAS